MTMKKHNVHPYSEISSFEDFQIEKARLLLKKKLIETRLKFSFTLIRKLFSFSNLMIPLAKEYILPLISGFLGKLRKKEADQNVRE
jgi:hypothetical protein